MGRSFVPTLPIFHRFASLAALSNRGAWSLYSWLMAIEACITYQMLTVWARDNVIYRINHFPEDGVVCFVNICPRFIRWIKSVSSTGTFTLTFIPPLARLLIREPACLCLNILFLVRNNTRGQNAWQGSLAVQKSHCIKTKYRNNKYFTRTNEPLINFFAVRV